MIRKIVKEDYDRVLELAHEVHKIHLNNRPDIYNDACSLPYNRFLEMLESGYNFAYEEEGMIIGIILGEVLESADIPLFKKRRVLYIDDIVVSKDYRKKAIGTKLYTEVKNKAIDDKIDSIELNVWAFNEDAINFYKKLGLKEKNIKMEEILNK